MAEALAGLSIAANVMQVIAFSRDIIITIRKLSDDRSPAPEVTANTESLQRLTEALRKDLTAAKAMSQQDKELDKVADRILGLANKMKKVLQDYQASARASKYKKFSKALKYSFYDRTRLKDLETSLDQLQKHMQSHILVDLRQQIKSEKTVSSAEFRNLDQTVQKFTKRLEAGVFDLPALLVQESKAIQDKVVAESEATRRNNAQEAVQIRQHVSSELHTTRQQIDDARAEEINNAKYEQLLQSLHFGDMNDRASKLDSNLAHHGTFEWIFSTGDDGSSEPGDKLQRTWDDLTEWLQGNEPVYWISGKPGSGKSTFMRFLVHDARTLNLFRSRGDDASIIAAYIWSAGSFMQRSLKGILCTLLHALLSIAPSLSKSIGYDRTSHMKRMPDDWSNPELERTFCKLVELHAQPICAFIDGLDEIDSGLPDGQLNLLNLISRLSVLDNLKLCVSSRPEAMLSSSLLKYPHLKLQDLTTKDIRHLVTSRLTTPPIEAFIQDELDRQDPAVGEGRLSLPSLKALVDAVTDRADGIFLWVCLVTQGILTGVYKADSWDMLLQRIERLPRELEHLYEDLWERQKDDAGFYRASTAIYLNTLLDKSPPGGGILNMLLVSEPQLCQRLLSGGTYVSSIEIYRRTHRFRQEVVARCCGLVDIYTSFRPASLREHNIHGKSENEVTELLFGDLQEVKFTFVHRSARDFLVDSTKGQNILGHDHRSPLEQSLSRFLAILAQQIIFGGRQVIAMLLEGLLARIYKTMPDSSFSLNLRRSIADLCGSVASRVPESIDFATELVLAAVTPRRWDLARDLILRITLARTLDRTQICSILLERSLRVLWSSNSNDTGVQEMMTWLFKNGADPNGIIHYNLYFFSEITINFIVVGGYGSNLPPFLSSLPSIPGQNAEIQFDVGSLAQTVRTLTQNGMDMSLRYLGCAGPASHRLAFLNINDPNSLLRSSGALPDDVAVLVDLAYPHFMNIYKITQALESQQNMHPDTRFLTELFDEKGVSVPRAVMLLKLHQSDEGSPSLITGLSAKLIHPEHSSGIVECCMLTESNSPPSPPASMDCEDPCFFTSYPNEVLDEAGIMNWLVEQNYLPRSVLDTREPWKYLVDASGIDIPAPKPHDRSKVDYSYHPEYDAFLDALGKCVKE